MKGIKSNPTAIQNATTTPPDIIVTLRDLKGILPDTQRVKKPKYSDLSKEQPLLTKLLPDGGIWVYANGFMVYRGESSRPYVLRVSEIKMQTYEFVGKTETCALDDLPWETALFLFGDEHRERNLLEWNERTQVQYDGFDECDDDSQSQGLVLPSPDNVEQAVAHKLDDRMERILGSLTTRQRQVVEMYYFQGLNQQAIADKLEISKPAVCISLQSAVDKLKNKSQENF